MSVTSEPVKRFTVNDPLNPDRSESIFPVIHEPKIPTMDKKLVIEAAIPGWHPIRWWRDRGVDNLPPLTMEAQVDAIAECVEAGASVIHTHPRDPKDGLPRIHAPDLMVEMMDRAFRKVDFITAHHTWAWDWSKDRQVDYISYTSELLERGKGNKYVQAAMIMNQGSFREDTPIHTKARIQEGVKWFEANGVKPMFSAQMYSFMELKRNVFDNGVARSRPYWIAIQMGKHTDEMIFADPWGYIQVINNMSMVREALPDAFIGVHPGGRNWLPAANMAILYGCELVRVGLEDQFWLYPHRDDISKKASDTVRIVANIARDLGREVATVDEARARLGIKLTSPG